MSMVLDTPVAETVWLPDPGYDYDLLFMVIGHVTSTGALGTARLTFRWTDPLCAT
jgi:hypothetical protein